jgi:hypothetical protein
VIIAAEIGSTEVVETIVTQEEMGNIIEIVDVVVIIEKIGAEIVMIGIGEMIDLDIMMAMIVN